MRETGKVLEIDKNTALIELISDKDSCRKCPTHSLCGLTRDAKRRVKTNSAQNVNVGDLVEIECRQGVSLKIAFLVYIVPLMMFFIGVAFAGVINKSQNIQLFFGSIFFILTFIILFFLDKRIKNSNKYLPIIIKVINSSSNP